MKNNLGGIIEKCRVPMIGNFGMFVKFFTLTRHEQRILIAKNFVHKHPQKIPNVLREIFYSQKLRSAQLKF